MDDESQMTDIRMQARKIHSVLFGLKPELWATPTVIQKSAKSGAVISGRSLRRLNK